MSQIETIDRKVLLRQIKNLPTLAKEITITTDSVDYLPYQQVIDLRLHLSPVKNWIWKDPTDKTKKPDSLIGALLTIVWQVLKWPLSISAERNHFRRSTANAQFNKYKGGTNALYIRSDHAFNLFSGGSVGHVAGVIDGLKDLKYDVQTVANDELANVKIDANFHLTKPKYNGINNIPEWPQVHHSRTEVKAGRRLNTQQKFDFIYQRNSLANYSGLALKSELQIPLVIEHNGSYTWLAENWGSTLLHKQLVNDIEQHNLKKADLVVVVSEPLRQQLLEIGVEDRRILVNPNGVNPDHYNLDIKPNQELIEKQNLQGKFVFGFIGTFAEWHGVLALAETINQFFKDYPAMVEKVKFLLIGDGKLRDEVEQIVSDGGFANNVILTGRIPQQDGPSYLAACDAFLSPHVPNPDGTPFFGSPTKLFEYLAMGKPTIASDLDQIGEILEDENTALLVPPADIEALSNAMHRLINDKNLQEKLAQNGQRLVTDHYTWTRHTEKIMNQLKAL